MRTIRTDNWAISLPSDWVEEEKTESGELYFKSSDGEKAMYIATWNLAKGDHQSPTDVAESFKANDMRTLHNMEGYSWRTIEEKIVRSETSTITVIDNLAREQSYRIVTKILASPPIVVRATFHDYACSDYAASYAYYAPIIESLCLYAAR
jgi:hypothetical protein